MKLSSRAESIVISVLLAAVTVAVYFQVTRHEFINYDDQEYITDNSIVQQGLTSQGVVWAFTQSYAANWHPLTWLSHMLDCQLFGLRAGGHHLMNVLIHGANVVVLFLLMEYLTRSRWRSVFVAALFALHPLHVESVAWVAERKDVLSAFFGLCSLWAYSAYARRVNETLTSRLPHYLLSCLLLAVGLLSKPMLVTLPFVMLLLDFWPLQRFPIGPSRWQVGGRLLLEKVPFFALAAISCAATLLAQSRAIVHEQNLPLTARLANAAISYVRYLEKTFWPTKLAVIYPHPGLWPTWATVASVLLLIVISIVVFLQARKRPYLSVGWFWYVGTLVPVIGLVQVGVQSIADRYTYLPLIGIFIIVAWGGAECVKLMKMPLGIVRAPATAIITICACLAWHQLKSWRDTESVFLHAAAVVPRNWVAEHNLALYALSRYQQIQRGTVATQLLKPDPRFVEQFASDKSPREYLKEVIARCQSALEVKPNYSFAHITMAKGLAELGELDQAQAHVNTALELDPQNAEAHQILAESLFRRGRAREAILEYKAALRYHPDWESVMNNLAWLLATHPNRDIRDGPEAVRLAERACELTSGQNIWFLHTLAAAYAEAGKFTNAVNTVEAAKRLAAARGQSASTEAAEKRIGLYISGQPYRDPGLNE
jgi:tetratricopeptide (TPR) repeat protein